VREMCDINENELNEDMEDDTSLESLSKDELIDVIEQLMNSKDVEVNTENIQNLGLNEKEFAKGLSSVSLIAGQYTGLKNVGIDSASAIDILINMANTEFNLKLNEMTCTNNKAVAGIQQTISEQNQV